MNSFTRKKQIEEILGYDKEINERAYNLVKKQVAKWDSEENQLVQDESPLEDDENALQPYEQVNTDYVGHAQDYIIELRILLETRRLLLPRMLVAGLDSLKADDENFNEVVRIQDVIKTYNNMAYLFVNSSNTTRTKLTIRNEAMRLAVFVEFIWKRLKELVDK